MTYDEKLWILRNHLREGYIPNPKQFAKSVKEVCYYCGKELDHVIMEDGKYVCVSHSELGEFEKEEDYY